MVKESNDRITLYAAYSICVLVAIYSTGLSFSLSLDGNPGKIADSTAAIYFLAHLLRSQTAQIPKNDTSQEENGISSIQTPRLVFQMHIPKTGGRTLMIHLGLWLNTRKEPNCLVAPCCTSREDYTKSVKASFAANYTCKAISREISVSGIQATKEILNIPDNLWYQVSLYRNPINRFVSAVRHNLRQGRCESMDMTRAVEIKLNRQCRPVGHDREQAQYFFDFPVSLNENETKLDYFVPKDRAVFSRPWPTSDEMRFHLSNFSFIGITGYMDATNCLLALQLASLRLMNESYVLREICNKSSRVRLDTSLPDDPDNRPLTTQQFMEILLNWHPLDAQTYPMVLESFRRRLNSTLHDFPQLIHRFQSNLTAVTFEHGVWSKVAMWLRQFQLRSTEENHRLLFQILDDLDPYEKDVLAPGLKWGKT